MFTKDILNVVDVNDNVIGQETREKIHKEGLLHREVNVWFYNNSGEVIFQLRSMDQEFYPGLLDATAGGHVEIGDSYEETAVKEVKEETGVYIDPAKLSLIQKVRSGSIDDVKKIRNNKFQARYIFMFGGLLSDLIATEGEGFEAWPVDKILNIREKDKSKFIDLIFEESNLQVFRKIKELTS